MSENLPTQEIVLTAVEKAIANNDLANLTPEQRMSYFRAVCNSVGLNPLTKPFDFIPFQGKLVLYANKGCAEQLRDIHNISVSIVSRDIVDSLLVVTARAQKGQRVDESIAAIDFTHLKGESKANAMMKAETKAKRRVTLSICGLGMLDESEVNVIPDELPDSPADRLNASVKALTFEPIADVKVEPKTLVQAKPAVEMSCADKARKLIDVLEKKGKVPTADIEKWCSLYADSRIPDDFTEADVAKLKAHYELVKAGKKFEMLLSPVEDMTDDVTF